MSLINDALKQAKQAQDPSHSVTTPGLEFRAADRRRSRPARNLTLPAVIFLSAAGIVLALWKFYPAGENRATATGSVVAAAAPASAPSVAVAPAPNVQPSPMAAPVASTTTQPPSPRRSEPAASEPKPPSTTINISAITPIVPDVEPDTLPNVIVVKSDSGNGSNPARSAAPGPAVNTPSKPAAPKLQGIVFSSTRPSAMISGRTLFIGDKFGDQKVTRIEIDSVTLVSATQTNVMSLTP